MRRFIVCILMTVCIFGLAACGQPKSEDIRAMIVDKTYIYEKEGIGGNFTIHINDDGTFLYHEGPLSSYLGIGIWFFSLKIQAIFCISKLQMGNTLQAVLMKIKAIK